MALTITATWLPDVFGYRLDAAGSTGTVTWHRSVYWADGRNLNTVIGTGVQLFDLTVPLDEPAVTYTAIDAAAAASATVYPISDYPVLGLANTVDVPAVKVMVESLREQNVTGRTAFFDIIDQNEPWFDVIRPVERTGTMTLHMPHPNPYEAFPSQGLDRLRKMLRTGQAMTLRSTCNERVEDLYFVFTRWSEQQVGAPNHHGPDRRIVIDWRAVDPMWGEDIQVSGRVWGLVPLEFATWTATVAGAATWQDLVDKT